MLVLMLTAFHLAPILALLQQNTVLLLCNLDIPFNELSSYILHIGYTDSCNSHFMSIV